MSGDKDDRSRTVTANKEDKRRYLSEHPEVRKMLTLFISRCIEEHPASVEAFSCEFFSDPAMPDLVAQRVGLPDATSLRPPVIPRTPISTAPMIIPLGVMDSAVQASQDDAPMFVPDVLPRADLSEPSKFSSLMPMSFDELPEPVSQKISIAESDMGKIQMYTMPEFFHLALETAEADKAVVVLMLLYGAKKALHVQTGSLCQYSLMRRIAGSAPSLFEAFAQLHPAIAGLGKLEIAEGDLSHVTKLFSRTFFVTSNLLFGQTQPDTVDWESTRVDLLPTPALIVHSPHISAGCSGKVYRFLPVVVGNTATLFMSLINPSFIDQMVYQIRRFGMRPQDVTNVGDIVRRAVMESNRGLKALEMGVTVNQIVLIIDGIDPDWLRGEIDFIDLHVRIIESSTGAPVNRESFIPDLESDRTIMFQFLEYQFAGTPEDLCRVALFSRDAVSSIKFDDSEYLETKSSVIRRIKRSFRIAGMHPDRLNDSLWSVVPETSHRALALPGAAAGTHWTPLAQLISSLVELFVFGRVHFKNQENDGTPPPPLNTVLCGVGMLAHGPIAAELVHHHETCPLVDQKYHQLMDSPFHECRCTLPGLETAFAHPMARNPSLRTLLHVDPLCHLPISRLYSVQITPRTLLVCLWSCMRRHWDKSTFFLTTPQCHCVACAADVPVESPESMTSITTTAPAVLPIMSRYGLIFHSGSEKLTVLYDRKRAFDSIKATVDRLKIEGDIDGRVDSLNHEEILRQIRAAELSDAELDTPELHVLDEYTLMRTPLGQSIRNRVSIDDFDSIVRPVMVGATHLTRLGALVEYFYPRKKAEADQRPATPTDDAEIGVEAEKPLSGQPLSEDFCAMAAVPSLVLSGAFGTVAERLDGIPGLMV
ncbi:hypothetical protein J8273_6147 [Carpediemonas membranifera]|uniref:Uncharacterized protein n=1 Tax=Carpediemonas membranifera TaxID=201153 RepID=A0A8J6E234_9EUKA|nr:hypothetical protein J8273_6147 [Carpediemonas membranifera]|eukprot:KAG9391387.1 hypothetical protein J8273_6147 [Carpediemonas membranifera]